ncbi:hypothetical protein C8_274 [Cannes 8 virus]|uniref:hypothetical protein n=1 Tax=Melbournevirus TaxID=1560514 RepID=UPI000392C7BE|nr:hypothetical protein MEL_233 [Melbournevirus]AGV01623.1 hypothetical protein C8_274 [Cannes 8 virus]AIT54846.1 hypothetical protein MEL_233 [Melbournevirus]
MFRPTHSQTSCQESCRKTELRQKCGEKANYRRVLEVGDSIASECKAKCDTYENSRAFATCKVRETAKCTEVNRKFSQRTYQCEQEAIAYCKESNKHNFLWKVFG